MSPQKSYIPTTETYVPSPSRDVFILETDVPIQKAYVPHTEQLTYAATKRDLQSHSERHMFQFTRYRCSFRNLIG